MNHRHGRRSRATLAVLAVASAALSGCSSDHDSADPPIVAPAAAAQSPPVTSPPAGAVYRFAGSGQAALVDAATKNLVVLADNGGTLNIFALSAPQQPPRTIALSPPATALADDDAGRAYLSTTGGYLRVDIGAGRAEKVDIAGHEGTHFTAVTRRADSRLALGDDHGTVYTLSPDNRVERKVDGFTHVDSLVSQENTVVVLDRAQTSVTTLAPDGDHVAHALRAGEGASTMLVDDKGRLLAADTRAGALLVFGVDPLILRQRYPAPGSPYGLTYSRNLVWVSQTASNTVVGYDLSTGIPEERARYSTVRQPNSLASDGTTLFVVSGSGDGLQAIDIGGVR